MKVFEFIVRNPMYFIQVHASQSYVKYGQRLVFVAPITPIIYTDVFTFTKLLCQDLRARTYIL